MIVKTNRDNRPEDLAATITLARTWNVARIDLPGKDINGKRSSRCDEREGYKKKVSKKVRLLETQK